MLNAAVRSLVRQPAFTCAAIATLAIGIAAPTAIFSTVNAALLQPLPYPRPADIYTVRTYMTDGRFTIGLVGTEEMSTLRALAPQIEAAALGARRDATVTADGSTREVVRYAVSPGFFELFGLPMTLGRGISEADDARGVPPSVVLSNGLWRRAYGARPDIVGTAITMSGVAVRVVGVANPAFDVPAGTDLWSSEFMLEGVGHVYDGYVRLKPDTTVAAMQPAMAEAMSSLAKKYPDMEVNRAYRFTPLLTTTVGDLGPLLVILFGATALLLVLAAVNVAGLMLARNTTRARDISVRMALGASRGRVAAQVLGESFVLSVLGGTAGILIAYWGTRVLMRLGAARLPRLATVPFDVRVAFFAAGLVVLTSIAAGLAPAVRSSDVGTSAIINETGRGIRGSRRTRRALALLVAAELAVSIAVVAGAVRLAASYERLRQVDPGFVADGRLVLDVLLPPPPRMDADTYVQTLERQSEWWDATRDRLRQAGAATVGAASGVPLEREADTTVFVDLVSRPDTPPQNRPNGRLRTVTPGFFRTAGIALLAGRDFADTDRPGSPLVTIVNEEFIRRFMPDADALREQVRGFTVHVRDGKGITDPIQIVGVVRNVKYAGLTAAPEPTVYVPISQTSRRRFSILVTSSDGHPELHADTFRRAVLEVEPRAAIDITTMSSLLSTSLQNPRLGTWLMSGFGIAALVLAVVGVFAVVAYNVSQRTAEFAVRQALGATRRDVYRAVLVETGRTAAGGVIVGVMIAWWTGRLIAGYVFQVPAADPGVLAASTGIVVLAAAAATLVPARRAASLDPARALRLD